VDKISREFNDFNLSTRRTVAKESAFEAEGRIAKIMIVSK